MILNRGSVLPSGEQKKGNGMTTQGAFTRKVWIPTVYFTLMKKILSIRFLNAINQ